MRTFRQSTAEEINAYRQRVKQLNRASARRATLLCPFAIALFTVAGYSNFQQGDLMSGLVCIGGALSFLTILFIALYKAVRREG